MTLTKTLPGLILLALMAVSTVCAAEDYRDAMTAVPLFRMNELGLMGIEREQMADEMAAFVANQFVEGGKGSEAGKNRHELATRMLAMALQLHPRCRNALVANFKLRRGVPTEAVDAEYEPELLAEYLYTRANLLKEQGGDQNALLAGYLLAISVEIDPTNEDAIYELEIRKIDGNPVDWSRLLPPPGKAAKEGKPRGDH